MNPKLSEPLQAQLKQLDTSGKVEVIIELHETKESPAVSASSRQEKIAAMKESFEREVAPIDDIIRSWGGEVTGHAWINRTLRARVPVDKVEQLSTFQQIAKIDLPRKLEPDA